MEYARQELKKIDIPRNGIVMYNSVFIPDDRSSITPNGFRKGTIHYKFNASPYQGISWSFVHHKSFCKIKELSDIAFYEKMLSSDEKEEYKGLFNSLRNLNITPEENVIKECIIVFTNGEIAVGLKAVAPDIFTVFKSTKIHEIKAICKKYNVKIYFDNKIALTIFNEGYLNEIPPDLKSIAEKFVRLLKKDKIFQKRLSHYFPDSETAKRYK
jgi:hypothetical protein